MRPGSFHFLPSACDITPSDRDGWVTSLCGGIVHGVGGGYTAHIAPDKPRPGSQNCLLFPAGWIKRDNMLLQKRQMRDDTTS